METYIFLGLVGMVRLATGIILLQLASRNNLPNLKWLAWGFISTVIAIPITASPYVPFVDKAIAYVTYLCFALFISQTFYSKRSPFPVFWAIFTILHLSMFWFASRFMAYATGLTFPHYILMARPPYESVPMDRFESIDSVIYGILQMAIWVWHAVAGFRAGRFVANDTYVEDWVKGRYRWIIAYSLLQSLIGLALMVRPFVSPSIVILSALLVMVTTTMQYLVWAMPGWFYKWLNRNQESRVREMVHEQAVAILNILGTAMSEGTGLTKMLAMFALRKAISIAINTEDANKIEAHAAKMDYQGWIDLLNTSDFRALVKNSSDVTEAREIIQRAETALNRKQSLFTLQAR